MLKKTRGRWLLLSLLALVPFSSAHAFTSGGTREGRAQGHDVHVDIGTSTAWGALGTARLEPLPDPNGDTYIEKGIGCYVETIVPPPPLGSTVSPPGYSEVHCNAFSGKWLACLSADPAMVAAVEAMNGDSKITFSVNASGFCATLKVENNSIYQQKAN